MDKNKIKELLQNLDLNGYNYICKDNRFIYFSKRCNDYKSKFYGMFKQIKCTEKDILNKNIVNMCKFELSL